MFFAATDCNQQICRYVRAGATGTGLDWSNAYGALPTVPVRGTTYFIADGSYPGRTLNQAAVGNTLITIKKAISSDHGTSTGWQEDYGDGQATFTNGFEINSSYWIIDGQTGGGANNWDRNFGFKIIETSDDTALIRIGYDGTANNISISHVAMQGKGSVSAQGGSYSNDGLALWGVSGITLSYFHMKGIGRGPFFVSAKDVVIEHGWVESFFGSADVHSEIASIWGFDGNVGDITFRYNLFTDVQSTGGLMWDNSSNPSSHMYVYGNVFYKPTTAVWSRANGVIGGWTSNSEFHNAIVYNNTFININQQSLSTLPQVASGNRAFNNIFYNCESPDFSKFTQHDYNHFINSGGIHGEVNGTSSSGGNPFVNFVALDFRLLSATVKSMTLPLPFNKDPFSKNRGADGLWDRGAYEFIEGGLNPTKIKTPTNFQVR